MSDLPPKPSGGRDPKSAAFRAGRCLQAALLAVLIAAVVLRLLQIDYALKFRYGGF